MREMATGSTTIPLPNPKDTPNTSTNSFKKFPSKKHYCSFNCGWCLLVGRSIIEQKYRDFGNILLEDDLSYDFFGRELVK